jgi:hypothetical protein
VTSNKQTYNTTKTFASLLNLQANQPTNKQPPSQNKRAKTNQYKKKTTTNLTFPFQPSQRETKQTHNTQTKQPTNKQPRQAFVDEQLDELLYELDELDAAPCLIIMPICMLMT